MAINIKGIGGLALTVVGCTGNGVSPIVITVNALPSTVAVGQRIVVASVGGNTNANGTKTITAVNYTSKTITFAGTGNGAYTSGGTVAREYATVALWNTATQLNLVAIGDIEIGEIYNDGLMTLTAASLIMAGATTNASRYRHLRAWNGGVNGNHRYDPASASGVRIKKAVTPTFPNVIELSENYFRLEGIYFEITDGGSWAGSGTARGVNIAGACHHVRIDGVTVRGREMAVTGGSAPVGIDGIVHQQQTIFSGVSNTYVAGDELIVTNSLTLGHTTALGLVNGIRTINNNNDQFLNSGSYNCKNGIGRGFHLAATSSFITNCWSAGSSFADFTTAGSILNSASGDNSATGINCQKQLSPTDAMINPEYEDFRLRYTSSLLNKGLSQASLFTTDINGTTRTGEWEIGPYANWVADLSAAPTEIVSTIGTGKTYSTIQDWADATAVHCVYTNVKHVGVVYDVVALSGILKLEGAICDSRRYRELRCADNTRYIPYDDQGNSIDLATANVAEINEKYFRLSGFRFYNTENTASGSTFSCLKITDVGALVEKCTFYFPDGSAGTRRCVEVTSLGLQTAIRNCICIGGAEGLGANHGFYVTGVGSRVQNCDVYRVRRGAGATHFTDNGVAGIIFENCFSATVGATDTGFVVVSGYSSHNASTDASAVGLGCISNVTLADEVVDAADWDFRLKSSSQLVNAGKNLSLEFTDDFNGAERLGSWEIGAYTGYFAPPDYYPIPILNTARIAKCFVLERQDGRTFYSTDNSEPVVFRGKTFSPVIAAEASARRHESAMKSGSLELVGMMSSDMITHADLRARRYDNAVVYEFVIDPRFPWVRERTVRVFKIASVEFTNEIWTAQLDSAVGALQRRVGDKCTTECRYQVGSKGQCDLDMRPYTAYAVTVATVILPRLAFTLTSVPGGLDSDDYFKYGKATWRSGDNVGVTGYVDAYTESTNRVDLILRTPFDVQVGDILDLEAGCDWQPGTCVNKFNNYDNYGGFPGIPGARKMWQTPTR